MTDPDLILAGYVLTVPADAPPGLSSLPDQILTISDCIMDALPRPEFWDWFQTLSDAELACSSATHVQITAVAMRIEDAGLLMDAMGGSQQPCFDTLSQHLPFDDEVLGYEVVGAEHSLDFHSWHCHAYADEVHDALHIQVNHLGLLVTYSDAGRVLEWMLARPTREAPKLVPWAVVALGAAIDNAQIH